MHRIALEATCLTAENPTGIGRYACELARGLAALKTDDQLLSLYRTSHYLKGKKNIPETVGLTPKLWSKNLPTLGGRNIDLVHATDHILPEWHGSKKVATIHDMYAHLNIDNRGSKSAKRRQQKYQRLADQADHIICVSKSTRDDFFNFYDYPAEKTSIIHHGVDQKFSSRPGANDSRQLEAIGISRPYLLYLGALRAEKNVGRLIQAFDDLKVGNELDLVIAGDGGQRDTLKTQAAKTRYPDAVRFTGFVSDKLIPVLYRQAQGYCLVSLYEGFGIPIIEALTSGTPVLTANIGGAAEIARSHAVTCDPQDVESIKTGLLALVAQRGTISEAAEKYANSFTWAKTASETYAVYQQLLAKG